MHTIRRRVAPRRALAVLTSFGLGAALALALSVGQAPVASARTDVPAFASAPGCGGSWTTLTAPANTVGVKVTLTGGGGGGGGADSGGGFSGPGGGGATVTSTLTGVSGGQVLSLTVGCGGGGGQQAGVSGLGGPSAFGSGGNGGSGNSHSGAGGGATALCLGNGSCDTILAVAGGGGGGGATWRCCAGQNPTGGTGGASAVTGPNGISGTNGGSASGTGGGGGGATLSGPGGNGGGGCNGAAGSGRNGGQGGGDGGCVGGGGGGGGYFGGGGAGGGNGTFSEAGGAGGGGSSFAASGTPSYTSSTARSTACGRIREACGTRTTPGLGGANAPTNQHGFAGEAGTASVIWVVNETPTGGNQTLSVNKGTAAAVNLAASSDPDGDNPTSCVITSSPTKGSLGGSGCARTYTATPNQPAGTDTFTYRVQDSIGGQSPTYTITLNIQNRAPTSAPQTVTVSPGSSTSITFGGSDADGEATTCATSTPSGGSLSGGTACTRTYTAPSALGTYSFTYTRSDSYSGTSPAATITVNVVAPDMAISKYHNSAINAGAQGTYSFNVWNDGNAATTGAITVTDVLPAGMTYVSADVGSSGFSCSADGPGTTVTCTRGAAMAAGAEATFHITVTVAEEVTSVTNTASVSTPGDVNAANNTSADPTTANRRPTAAPVTASTTVGTPVAVTLAGSDPEGGALTYQVGTPSSGSLSGAAPNLTFTPAVGSDVDASFSYTVTDLHGHVSFAATVTVTVTRPGVHGVVTADGSGDPIAGITVRLYQDGTGFTSHSAITDGDGWYDLGGSIPAGSYRVIFRDPDQDYVDEWYDDSLLRSTSTPVTVTAGGEITADAGLAAGGQIDVTITNPGTYTVSLYNSGPVGASAYRSVAGVSGSTALRGLPAGTYYVAVTDPAGALLAKWSGNETVRGEAEAITLGTGLTVARSFTLVPPNTIGGTVTDSEGPVEGVTVQAYTSLGGTYVKAAKTDADGEYAIKGLAPGGYKLVFRDSSGAHPLVWSGGGEVIGSAPTVIVPGGGVVTVDEEIPVAATVSGTVTGGPAGTTPLAGAKVTLYRNGTAVKTYVADGSGAYVATGLAAGDYTALFTAAGHRTEYNLDRARKADADVIEVEPGAEVTVDATLAPS